MSPENCLQAFTRLKIFHRLFTPWSIMKRPYKFSIMILAWKQNLFWTRFARTFELFEVDENFFFNNLVRLPAMWDFKPSNAILLDSPSVYTREKNINLGTIDKIHKKCDVIDASIVGGLRHPIVNSFILKTTWLQKTRSAWNNTLWKNTIKYFE